jgi:hypothetical protein
MTAIDFYALSRAVQDSLLDSMSGQFTPAPLLVRPGPRRSALAWLGVAVAAALALAILAGAGYGEVQSPLALPPMGFVGIYAGLAALAFAAALNALALRAKAQDLPFGPGIFVFPACLVDARTASLRVLPLSELTQVSARGGAVVLAFGGKTYAFPPATPGEVEASVQAVENARAELANAADEEARRLLDPLAAPSVASPLTPDVARTRTAPPWEKWRFLVGAAAGAAIGVALFFARDAGSDARCLAWARARNDVPSYEKYLSRGRRHTDLVAKELLPRAAFREAVAQGSVEAIDAFARAHPGTKIQGEIDAAREAAVLAELERAKKAATFASVLGFGEKYPDKRKDPTFVQAKHALYARALDRYLKETHEPVADILKRLVAAAEKVEPKKTDAGYKGGIVEVRVRRMPSKEMDRSDDLVRKSPMFNGVASLVTTHLDDPHFIPQEKALADALAAAFTKAFDPEILTFEAKPRLEDGDGKLPDPKVPTLYVSYRVESSGAALASKKPRGIFLGLTFSFSVELVVPGEAQTFKSKLTSTERIPLAVLKDASPTAAAGTIEGQVYAEMTRHAFEELREKYLGIWFKKH